MTQNVTNWSLGIFLVAALVMAIIALVLASRNYREVNKLSDSDNPTPEPQPEPQPDQLSRMPYATSRLADHHLQQRAKHAAAQARARRMADAKAQAASMHASSNAHAPPHHAPPNAHAPPPHHTSPNAHAPPHHTSPNAHAPPHHAPVVQPTHETDPQYHNKAASSYVSVDTPSLYAS